MRYETGKISVANGSVIVEGQGTRWKSVVRIGDMLWVEGLDRVWQVAQIVSDTQIVLSRPIVIEGADSNLCYAIAADFTPHLSIPYPNVGETESSTILNRAVEILEKRLSKSLGLKIGQN